MKVEIPIRMDIIFRAFVDIESQLITSWLNWPTWALRIVEVLLMLIALVAGLQSFFGERSDTSVEKTGKLHSNNASNKEFRWFQFQYLSVYFVVMLADWLQGTNMYTLYSVCPCLLRTTHFSFIDLNAASSLLVPSVLWCKCR